MRWIRLIVAAALLQGLAWAQQVPYAGLRQFTTSAVLADSGVRLIGSGITLHQITWTKSGTVSACAVQVDNSVDNVTWTPAGTITSQTCTSNGNVPVTASNVNYIRMNVTSFTGTGSVTIVWTGYLNTANINTTSVKDVTSFTGTGNGDAGDKLNACILAIETAGGGICDARGLAQTVFPSTSVNLCQQASGTSNIKIIFGRITWFYSNTGDAFTCVTPDSAAFTGQKIDIEGSGRLTTLFTVSGTCNSVPCVAASLFHLKYTSYVQMYDLSMQACGCTLSGVTQGQATSVYWSDQTINTTLTMVDIYGNQGTSVAGQKAVFLSGAGFEHWTSVVIAYSQYPLYISTNDNAIPAAVRNALFMVSNASFKDGNDVHDDHFTDLVVTGGWKSNIFIDATVASVTNQSIQDITFTGLFSTVGGLDNADVDDDSCLYVKGQTSRQVRGLNIFGGAFEQCRMHGIFIDGNVARSFLAGARSNHNGNGTPVAYAIKLANGSVSGSPTENFINCVCEGNGTTVGDQGLYADTTDVRNELHINVGSTGYTIANTSDYPFINDTTNSGELCCQHGYTKVVRVTTNFTTANNANFQIITGLNWKMMPNVAINARFDCYLTLSQATAAVSDSLGIQAINVAPTNIFGTGQAEITIGAAALPDSLKYGTLATLTTTTATAIVTFTPSAIATNYNAELHGMIENPSNTALNNIAIEVKTTTGADAITVLQGSYCSLSGVQ